MKTFRSWVERVAAAAGLIPAVLFDTRRSTAGEERQVASHDQQKEAIVAKFGGADPRQASREHQVGRGGAPHGAERREVLRARPSGVHRRRQLLRHRRVGFHRRARRQR